MKPKPQANRFYNHGGDWQPFDTIAVIEREKDKPVIYTADGKPLVRPAQPVGFKPRRH